MFSIDNQSRTPVYEQIIKQIERFILAGHLLPDEQLPSVRNVSCSLSVNPNTIQKAFADLDRRGIIYSVPGKGSFVSAEAAEIITKSRIHELEKIEAAAREMKLAQIDKKIIINAVEKIYLEKEREVIQQ